MQVARRFPGVVAVGLLLAIVSTAAAKYSGGSGTTRDPYQIATAADLIALGETPADYDKHFILTADIDLALRLPGRKVFDKAVIAPVTLISDPSHLSTVGAPFTGVFDGNNHTVSHLTLTRLTFSPEGCVGLFGCLESGAEVKNLGVVNVNITTKGFYVGSLVGCNFGKVTQCHSTGSVSGTGYVGGLVGLNYSGSLTACYSTCAVSGDSRVGGLAGNNGTQYRYDRPAGSITQCYSTGRVSASGWGTGGLVGVSDGTVSQCYSTATVSGGGVVGGLVGCNYTSVTQCYSAGAVSGRDNVGGLVGTLGTALACFWDIQTSGQGTSVGGTGKTTAEMQRKRTFAAWDFQTTWRIREGVDYPRLKWEPQADAIATTLEKVSGDNQQTRIGSKLPSPLIVRVKDQYGQTMATVEVAFTVLAGAGTVEPVLAMTDASGIASAIVTLGSTAGPVRIRAAVGSLAVDFSLQALGLPVVTNLEKVSGDSQQAMIGSKLPAPLTVRVKDQYGQAMAGVQVAFTVVAGAGTVEPALAVSNASGIASAIVTLGPTAGSIHVRAAVGSLSVDFSLEATPLPTATTLEKVSGDNQQAIIGSKLPSPLTVRVKDQYGQVMAGVQVAFTVVAGGATVEPAVAVSNASGIASAVVTLGPTAGRIQVRATVGSLSVDFSIEATPLPVATTLEKVSGDNQQAIIGSKLPSPLTVRVKDQYGQPMAGVAVAFTFVAGAGTVEPALAPTNASGIASAIVTLGSTAGSIHVKAAVGSLSVDFSIVGRSSAYSAGSGEPNDPYRIATAAELIALGERPADYGKHFILTADIDLDPKLPGRKVFDEAVIAPDVDPAKVDYQGSGFAGVLDGKGHTIAHLTIAGKGYLGLWGRLAFGSEVRNLRVVDVNIVGSDSYVGGLAGESLGSITTSSSTGAVKGRNGVGGLVGGNGGEMSRCYSTSAAASATGWWVGGLVGIHSGSIATSYSAGRVSATNSVGGLVGYGNAGTVTQCYSTSAVTGTSLGVGGLVGYNGATAVTECYSAGAVSGGAPGGLMGINHGEVAGCFWDTQTSGRTTSAGGTGKTTAEMQTSNTFLEAGWDLVGETANGEEDIWRILEGQDYPCLWWEGPRVKYGGGSGTPQDPYQIKTAEQMSTIGSNPNDWGKCFKLMADIDLSGFDGKQGRPAFKIIGTSTQNAFTGIFDGNGHVISGLTLSGGSRLGLFGQMKYPAEVKNLGLEDIKITTGSYVSSVGGLVGSNGDSSGTKGGTITNCYSVGTVSGAGPQSNMFGGLVGANYGEVSRCYSAAVVTGSWTVGGLVGSNGHRSFTQGVVKYCFSTGAVRANSAVVGGLVGDNYGTVTCCYSTGAVSGGSSDPWAGGLLGSNHGTVANCYSTGWVRGTGWYVGGLTCWSMGTITNCFWNTQTSGQNTSRGATGKTTAQMQIAKTFLDAGWDFVGETANGTEDIWWINEGKDYPRLWWELPAKK